MQSVPRLYESFKPDTYRLHIDIDRENRAFTGRVTIQGLSSAEDIRLHAKDLVVSTATVDGKAVEFSHEEFDTLVLRGPSTVPGDHVVEVEFSGTISDAMHGMYPCHFTHEGTKMELIATQFESHHAREVFPCVDEPEAKATFELQLTTEDGVSVLSNLHAIDETVDAARRTTTFATTPRMSTYLLAWVVGTLHKKTAHTASGVEVNIWATPAQRPESLDFALDHAVKSIEFFDDYFGVPYPLPKSDHVALPDFSSGAMENWGLITYREMALLADPASTTIASKQYIATVISHELSHQWFGNLVTMKWWNNLWLNESFATLMEYIAVDAIHPEWNAWLDFSTHESVMALRRDAIDGVQSVQVEVEHPDEIGSLFDGAIVYAKGARLMRMCEHYIGKEAFRNGLQSYFEEYAYANTEADDLWRHLSEASGKDIASFMNTWISQSGYPVVHIDRDGFRQEQFFIGPHIQSTKLWPIPLNAESTEDVPAMLETRELKTPVAVGERLNVGDTAHFVTHYPDDFTSAILARDDLTELDQLQFLHEQLLLVRGGIAESASLAPLVERFSQSSSVHVWEMIAGALAEFRKFTEDGEVAEEGLRNLYKKVAQKEFSRLGWTPQIGELEDDTKLRSIVLGMMAYSRDTDVLAHIDELYAQGVESIDPEIRTVVMSSVLRRASDSTEVEALLELYRSTPSIDLKDDISTALTSVEPSQSINLILETLTNTDTIRTQDTARWFVYLIRNKFARTATWQWMKDNWKWIQETFGGDKSFDYFPRYAASALSSRELREDYVEFFSAYKNDPALRRTIELGILEIDARIDLLERDGESVRQMLRSFVK